MRHDVRHDVIYWTEETKWDMPHKMKESRSEVTCRKEEL